MLYQNNADVKKKSLLTKDMFFEKTVNDKNRRAFNHIDHFMFALLCNSIVTRGFFAST